MTNRNFKKEMDAVLVRAQTEGRRPGVLLHACCAPCASSCLEYLAKNCSLTVFFYNPNIDTAEEYEKRAGELKRLMEEMFPDGSVRVITADWDHDEFENIAKGLEEEPERGRRCLKCYELRLRKTAEQMDGSFDFFATTLTLSPLKPAGAINEIGERIAKETGLSYLVSDFKKADGYKRSIELSKEHDLYRQDYCGCRFSKRSNTNGE